MGEFPSGQRGQTVNLLRFASMVRIRPPPPEKHQAVGLVFFSYIRLRRVLLAMPVIFALQVVLGFAQFIGEYNITSALAEISLSRSENITPPTAEYQ